MTDPERIEQLEKTLRILWGAMLAAKLMVPDNRCVQAAFDKADRECKKTGLTARAGCMFVEQENVE